MMHRGDFLLLYLFTGRNVNDNSRISRRNRLRSTKREGKFFARKRVDRNEYAPFSVRFFDDACSDSLLDLKKKEICFFFFT